MSLIVLIKETQIIDQGTFFFMVQLDEVEFPAKNKKTQKQRSQVLEDCKTNFPHFEKRIFKFENLGLGNRITLKLGLYEVQEKGIRVNMHNEQQLAEGAELVGAAAQVLKQSIVSVLRKGEILKKQFKLTDPLNPASEKGAMIVSLKLQFEKIDEVFYEDVKQIEKIYYDPFQDEIEEIQKNLAQVIKQNQKKSDELKRKMKGVDDINESLRRSGIDQAILKRQLEQLTQENAKLTKELAQKQSMANQAHIEIEVLESSPQGVDKLRERLSLLEAKIQLERRRNQELVLQQADIKPAIQQIHHSRELIKGTRKATQEQEKALARMKDDLERVKAKRETIKQQEQIIAQLTDTIKGQITIQSQLQDKKKGMTSADIKELEIEAQEMRYETQKLRERLKYINTVKRGNNGLTPIQDAEKLKQLEIEENKDEYDALTEKQEDLMGQLQRLVKYKQNYQQREKETMAMTGNEEEDMQRILLEMELKQKEVKIEQMEEAMMENTAKFARQVAEYKHQIMLLDAQLNTTVNKEGFEAFQTFQ